MEAQGRDQEKKKTKNSFIARHSAYAYNPSYSGVRDSEDHGSRPV
jgi:hypothetical protein